MIGDPRPRTLVPVSARGWLVRTTVVLLVGAGLGGVRTAGADDPVKTAYLDLFVEREDATVRPFAGVPVEGTARLAPEVRRQRRLRMRTELFEGLAFGHAQPVQLNLFRDVAFVAWISAPHDVGMGFRRWPVHLETSDPFAGAILIGSAPPRPSGTIFLAKPSGGPTVPEEGTSDGPPPAARPVPKGPLGVPASPSVGAARARARAYVLWITTSRGHFEIASDGAGVVTIEDVDVARLGDCAAGRRPGGARSAAPPTGRRGGCCGCCPRDDARGRRTGGGDFGPDDVDGNIVPFPSVGTPGNSGLTTIDLLVAYSTYVVFDRARIKHYWPPFTSEEEEKYVQADLVVQASIVAAVEDLNDALKKSMAYVAVRLVGPDGPLSVGNEQIMGKIPCAVGTYRTVDCQTMLSGLVSNPTLVHDSIRDLRDTYRADLVCLVVDNGKPWWAMAPGEQSPMDCGAGSYYYPELVPEQRREHAYSVVREKCLGARSLAHEFGHNLGACHFIDDYETNETSPIYCGAGYRHPFAFQSGDQRPMMTIMGRGARTRVDVFSNPDVYVASTWPHNLGKVQTADNARVIESNAWDVALYFP